MIRCRSKVIARPILVRALDRPTVRLAPQYPVRSGRAPLDWRGVGRAAPTLLDNRNCLHRLAAVGRCDRSSFALSRASRWINI
jgi:hypothetical protein